MYLDGYLWVYLPAVALLTLSPGVDTLLVIRNSLRGGWRDGLLTSFAICCGLFVHALISVGGISLVLLQSAWLFGALKLAGAGYLIWLGLASLRVALRGGELLFPASTRLVEKTHWQVSLREGFLSNVLNPKAIVFYLAFLPQFIQPGDPVIGKALFLAAIHFLIANLWQLVVVAVVIRVQRWLLTPSMKRAFDGLAGSMMIALGAKLGLAQ
ncbi:MAG: LysE family translocator [Chromatiaceae bacterium]|nr:LysE family translocator [Chromatiaceae bacterium]